MTPNNQLLTTREAARLLRISERHVFALTHPRGTLPCIRLGRAVRYDRHDLEEWLRTCRVEPTIGDQEVSDG